MTALQFVSLSREAHPPNGFISILAEEQASIFRDRNTDGAALDISVRRDETGYEIFVSAARFTGRFGEGDPNDFVTCASLAIPGTVEGREDVALIFRRELGAIVETNGRR
jgi:hypothetical protein